MLNCCERGLRGQKTQARGRRRELDGGVGAGGGERDEQAGLEVSRGRTGRGGGAGRDRGHGHEWFDDERVQGADGVFRGESTKTFCAGSNLTGVVRVHAEDELMEEVIGDRCRSASAA